MTLDDLAELERLLAEYRRARVPEVGRYALGQARKRLETALVKHADELIELSRLVLKLRKSASELKPGAIEVLGMPEPLGPIEVVSDDGRRQWVHPITGELWRGRCR